VSVYERGREAEKGEAVHGHAHGADAPMRCWTATPTWRPMCVLPVNDSSGRRRSSAISVPISAPPATPTKA
jgi:hypothetical protein